MMLPQLWSGFRRWPTWVQLIVWIVAWPIVAALLIAVCARRTLGRVVALAVLVVGGFIWFPALAAPDEDSTAATDGQRVEGSGDFTATGAPVASESPATALSAPTSAPTARSAASPKPVTVHPAGVPAGAQPAVVERIVDGDTVWVPVDDPVEGESMPPKATSKVRLLEIAIAAPVATSHRI